jgi:hypothetical protein
MPARDGTGPSGRGSRTGRGKGNCAPDGSSPPQNVPLGYNKPFGWGGRMWNATLGRLFRRRRANRSNQR